MKPLKTHSHTLPSSPIHHHHHSSSSDFEFTATTVSPRKSITNNFRPADELFHNGQLLPLHLSSSNSMVYTTTGRHSSDHHSSFSYDTSDSSRHSSATEDHNHLPHKLFASNSQTQKLICNQENNVLARNTFPFNKFSSIFRQETKPSSATATTITVKRMSVKAKEKIRKYLKKVKPLYEKLSQPQKTTSDPPSLTAKRDDVVIPPPSFPGNLRFLRRTSCVSSCPSTMPSTPTHSGVLGGKANVVKHSSSTEELQCAIQGAIAHCKNSMTQSGWKHK